MEQRTENAMIKYYKLFDLLNRREMKKTDLLEVISSKTLAKINKGENIQTEVINKICLFLDCQPGDIMEVIPDPPKKKTLLEKAGDYINAGIDYNMNKTNEEIKDEVKHPIKGATQALKDGIIISNQIHEQHKKE